MNKNNISEIKIYINIFVHYPNAWSTNAIAENFNKHFTNENLYSIYNPKCFVMVNSAPHSVEESLNIEISFSQKDVLYITEDIILDLREFARVYFNHKINNIEVELAK